MAQHVDVDWEADASTRPGLLHDFLCGCWCHWCPTLAHEQELTPLRLLTLEFTQHAQLPAGQRMYTAHAVLGTRYGHPARLQINLGPAQPHQLRHSQPVP